MGFNTQNKIKAEGGMASMTDLVFLLLIFFIIMSLMSEPTTPIDLPKPSTTSQETNEQTFLTVIITENNLYQINKEQMAEMPFEDFKDILIEKVEATPDKKLKIAGHKEANYQSVFEVIALSKAREWKPVLAYDK